MKILFDARAFQGSVSGMARATINLYIASLRAMPELKLIALHEKPLSVRLPQEIATSCPKNLRVLRKQVIWQSNILKYRPDFLHFPNNAFLPKRLWPGPKIVTTIHDVLPLQIQGFFPDARAEEEYCRRSQAGIDKTDLIITVSEYSKAEIMRHFKVRTEPVVIPLGPMLTALQPATPQKTPDEKILKEDYFIYVGGYDKRKGMDALVKVYLQLAKQGLVASKLYLTGKINYYSEQIQDLIGEGKKLGMIEELGYVPDQALLDLYRHAKALIYPSKYEGFGLPPLEAMAVGCPVITTPFMSLPEVCADAVCYIDPERELEFGEAIREVEGNSQLREEYRQKGLRQAQRFSWDKAAERFITLLARLQLEI